MVRAPAYLSLLLLTVTSVTASGPRFSTYLGGQWGEFATAVTTDSAGNVYAAGLTASPDFPVTPGAAQTTYGGANDAFIAKFSPTGALLWCTFFGGSSGDWATGIGVDAAGNVIVTGTTMSTDLPVVNAAQPSLDNGHLRYYRDAFVVKVSSDGSRFLYATYLGGEGSDLGYALAVDPAGNAYVTGSTESTKYFPGPNGFAPFTDTFSVAFVVKLSPAGGIVYTSFLDHIAIRGIAVDRAANVYGTGAGQNQGEQTAHAVVSKLSADGSTEVYRASIGGSIFDIGTAIAVDSSGSAWITGMAGSADFPLARPTQRLFGARSLWKSSDSSATWNSFDNAPFGQISAMLADSGTLYVAGPDGGLFVTPDGGATWSQANHGLTDTHITALVRDPASGALYAATQTGVFKSTNHAQTWTSASNGLPHSFVQHLAADPTHPGTLYASSASGIVSKTTDGGNSWSPVTSLYTACNNCGQALAVDPNTGNVFASAVPLFTFPNFFNPQPPPPPKSVLYRSTDGGATWSNNNNVFSTVSNFLVDPTTQPSTIYAGLLARSDDGGATWTTIHGPQGSYNPGNSALDPSNGALYVALQSPEVTLYVSFDHAATWQPLPGVPFTGPQGSVPYITGLTVDGASPGTLYLNTSSFHAAAFVSQLSPDGATLLFSTFLGGHQLVDAVQSNSGGYVQTSLYSVPGSTYGQGIAIDPAGNVVVTGATRCKDFPTVNPVQSSSANFLDAFITVFSPDASALLFSTYLGGGYSDGARAVAVDPQGAIVIAGETFSDDFPVVNAAQPTKRNFDDAFVLKLTWQ